MSSLLDELEQSWREPSLVPGGLPPLPNQPPASMVEELEATWEPAPAETPARLPGVGSGVLAIKGWLARNPQFALDIAAQTIATGAGTIVGTPGGVPGMMVGGAAGNVAGKQASRALGNALGFPDAQPRPELDSTETAIDAGLGAVGPVVQPLARMGARALTGLRKKPFDEAVGRVNREITARAEDELDLIWNSMSPTARARADATGRVPPAIDKLVSRTRAERSLELDNAVANEVAAATNAAAQRGTEPGRRIRGGLAGGLAGAHMLTEPVTGALIAAGLSDVVVRRAVPALLKHPTLGHKLARWALGAERPAPSAAMTSLTAIFAHDRLTREERRTLAELDNPSTTYDANADRHRDPASGRFVGGPVRHGERPDGTHPDDDESDDADTR